MKKIIKRVTAVFLVAAMQLTMVPQGCLQSAIGAEGSIPALEVHGYQISVAAEGHRTVYSVEPVIDGKEVVERGLIYGVEGATKESEMYCGSNGDYVLAFPAIEGLQSDKKFSESPTAEDYAMTMKFSVANKYEYNAKFMVRAYAKLSDGSYKYSEIKKYSIYQVADVLYNGGKMNKAEEHNYLYDNILSVVNPDTKKVDYAWSAPIVKPD